MKLAGLIYGEELHHLDHLAPLCALESIPLILTDEKMADLARKFYPDLRVLLWDFRAAPERLVREVDTIIYTTPRVLFDQIFYPAQALHGKRISTIFCPHGNSDKGRDAPLMEGLRDEELILTYGPRIEAFLREKGVHVPIRRVGNYRFSYYQKHRSFYTGLLPPKKRPQILYAPTWQDSENSSSFPHIWRQFLRLPETFDWKIKLHPHLYRQYAGEIEELRVSAALIEEFPPIYPLLDRADLLITDHSSVGYDFLVFNRPLVRIQGADKQLFEKCEKAMGQVVEHGHLVGEVFSAYEPIQDFFNFE